MVGKGVEKGVKRRREKTMARKDAGKMSPNGEAESLAHSNLSEFLDHSNLAKIIFDSRALGSLHDDKNIEDELDKWLEDWAAFSEMLTTFLGKMGRRISERNKLREENKELKREIAKWKNLATQHETCGARKSGVKKPRCIRHAPA